MEREVDHHHYNHFRIVFSIANSVLFSFQSILLRKVEWKGVLQKEGAVYKSSPRLYSFAFFVFAFSLPQVDCVE